jgi:hypothetical protein
MLSLFESLSVFFFNFSFGLEVFADFSYKLMGRIYFKFFEERFFLTLGVFLTALD